MSVLPPGAKGTTIRTGRDGYVCAKAKNEVTGIAAAPAARCNNCLRWGSFIDCSQLHDGPFRRSQLSRMKSAVSPKASAWFEALARGERLSNPLNLIFKLATGSRA